MLSVSYLPLPWHPRLSRQSAKDEGDMTMDSVASFTAAGSSGTRVCHVFPKRTKRQTSEKGRPLVGFDSCSTLRYHLSCPCSAERCSFSPTIWASHAFLARTNRGRTSLTASSSMIILPEEVVAVSYCTRLSCLVMDHITAINRSLGSDISVRS
jgi:hypothetical protein